MSIETADPGTPIIKRIRRPSYGRYLEQLIPGQVFSHPRGYSFDRYGMASFARTFMQANPLYLNAEFARAEGFHDLVASPQMVFNVVLSLGVQNDSEKAIANLGYYNVRFLEPVYSGDTINAKTLVQEVQDRGVDKPGIVKIRTSGVNQYGRVVVQYERKVMVGKSPVAATAEVAQAAPVDHANEVFPWIEQPPAPVVPNGGPTDTVLTGTDTYAEDFEVGDVIVHPNGRTIGEEHMALTYMFGNTHPLHFDRLYSQSLSGKMSGEPIVYGGLVFAWLDGLSSRDLSENSVWEIGFTEGYHTQPSNAGDTLTALSRIVAKTDFNSAATLQRIDTQLIGLKNITAQQALDKYQQDLFIAENTKKAMGKEKITDKVFEVVRSFLIKKRKPKATHSHG